MPVSREAWHARAARSFAGEKGRVRVDRNSAMANSTAHPEFSVTFLSAAGGEKFASIHRQKSLSDKSYRDPIAWVRKGGGVFYRRNAENAVSLRQAQAELTGLAKIVKRVHAAMKARA